MARALYRSVSCNINTFSSAGDQESTMREAWASADVLKINEGGDAVVPKTLRSIKGLSYWRPAGTVGNNDTIAWRDSVFTKVNAGSKTAYVGKGDGNGPSRGCNWVLLKHKATGKYVLEFCYHNVNKAWTDKPGRRDIWNQVQAGVGAEIQRVMGIWPGVPVVISGDTNKPDNDGAVTFPPVTMTYVSTPPSWGSNHYDQFHIKGTIRAISSRTITTKSDHKTVVVQMEITTPAPAKPAPAPKPVVAGTKADPTVPKPPKPESQVPPEDLRRRATFRRRPEWRYFAQRMTGDGANGEIIHSDLPLSDVEIEDNLTGHNALSGTINPEFASLLGSDGRPLLDEWGTAIWAEESGNIHGGGILTHSGFEGPKWGIECIGLTGYSQKLPYGGSVFFVEADPANIIRHIWNHIQSQPGGNVGLEVDPLVTGLQIGTELSQGEFDTVNGPLSFESGPYKLAWYQDHDLAENLDTLAADHSIDWHEEHYWSGDNLHHRLRLGFPKLGARRTDLRFVLGENVMVKPSVDRDGEDYADEVWALGAGEGSTIMRGIARKDINRLRRVAVIADPSQRTQYGVNSLASRDLAWRNTLETVTEIVVRDHPHADIGSLNVGDEINVMAEPGWVTVDGWYRVVSRRITPSAPNVMTLSIIRSDKISA